MSSESLSDPIYSKATLSIDVPQVTNDALETCPGFGKLLYDISGEGHAGWLPAIQSGTGAPDASTPTLPHLYKSETGVLYAYDGSSWSSINGLQTGTGAPNALTPSSPVLYKDQNTGVLYCWSESEGSWGRLVSSIEVTDGTNSQVLDGSSPLTFQGGDLINVSVTAPNLVTCSVDTSGGSAGDVLAVTPTGVDWVPNETHPELTVPPTSNPAVIFDESNQTLALDISAPGSYDNSTSGTTADNIQGVLDEIFDGSGLIDPSILPSAEQIPNLCAAVDTCLDADGDGVLDNLGVDGSNISGTVPSTALPDASALTNFCASVEDCLDANGDGILDSLGVDGANVTGTVPAASLPTASALTGFCPAVLDCLDTNGDGTMDALAADATSLTGTVPAASLPDASALTNFCVAVEDCLDANGDGVLDSLGVDGANITGTIPAAALPAINAGDIVGFCAAVMACVTTDVFDCSALPAI